MVPSDMGWREVAILGRLASGFALFVLGVVLTYRLDLNYKRTELIVPFLIALCGSIILLGFRWPL